jgi:Arc/MetJ-type ribon-helix-helix transcriptional regulator
LSSGRRGLRIVSVRIPEDYYEAVMTLVERGLYPSLSEAIRRASHSYSRGTEKHY